jgi:hypothetical protein
MMPESILHARLVKELSDYISIEFFNGDSGKILRDSSGVSSNDRCYNINGFIPDVIARAFTGALKCVIGEAKTPRDIETRHTMMQLESYLTFCSQEGNSALLVVAVPWAYHRLARQILVNISKKKNLNAAKFIVPSIFRA